MIVKKVYSGVPAGFDPKRRLVTNWKKTEAWIYLNWQSEPKPV